MDGREAKLREELERLLNQAADVAAELHQSEAGETGVPHFSQIESAAHQVGRDVSCRIQARHANEVASNAPQQAPCPGCGRECDLKFKRRSVNSTDGPVDLLEPFGECDRCRRSFFPSAAEARPG